MTQEIIEMARQAKLPHYWETGDIVYLDAVETFAKLVAEREREACAKVCDDIHFTVDSGNNFAKRIRARGQT